MINKERTGLHCVGAMYPGFGTIDEMSQDKFIEAINSSGADFLIASLGAEKGQLWLLRNHHRLRVPIRSHLGAVINFQAGSVRRAPPTMRRLGVEWLWRIKQEPHLWSRYWNDGRALLSLMLIYVMPLAVRTRMQRLRFSRNGKGLLLVKKLESSDSIILEPQWYGHRFTCRGSGSAFQRSCEIEKNSYNRFHGNTRN